jgi:putative tricarboxylic transport membrane protein
MAADRIFGAVMIVLALGYILSAMNIQTSFMSDPVGPRLFPYMVAGVVIVCALVMVLKPDPNAEWPSPLIALKIGAALALLVGYALVIRPLGFIVPTVVASAVLSYMISPRLVPAALAGLGLGIGLYVLFKVVLGLGLVALPRGWM